MFGASVSELYMYLLIKPLINIERTVDLCVSDDKVLPIDQGCTYTGIGISIGIGAYTHGIGTV